MSANTRIDEKRLDLPLSEFLVDLYAVGLEESGVLTADNKKLTAQQTWPFVASAYSTNGTPRPCWFIIRHCDEIDQLIAYMKRAGEYGNGYLKRRMPQLLSALQAYKTRNTVSFVTSKDTAFKDLHTSKAKIDAITDEQKNPFTPAFLRKHIPSDQMNTIIHDYVAGTLNAGNSLAAALELQSLTDSDKKIAIALLQLCYDEENKNGLVLALRTESLKNQVSTARKMMFTADFLENGPTLA